MNAQVKKTAPPPEPRISVLKSQVESKSSSPPAPADNIAKKDVDEIIDFIEGNKNIVNEKKRQKKERRVTESFTTQILEKRSRKSKLKINTPFVKLSCSSELKRVLKQKEKEAKLAEKKAAQPAKPGPGKPKPKEDDAEVDPSKYTDNRKKFI